MNRLLFLYLIPKITEVLSIINSVVMCNLGGRWTG